MKYLRTKIIIPQMIKGKNKLIRAQVPFEFLGSKYTLAIFELVINIVFKEKYKTIEIENNDNFK
jgi:hypothetical protein